MTTQKKAKAKVKRPYKGGPGWVEPKNAQGLTNLAYKGQATPKVQSKSEDSWAKEIRARDDVPSNGETPKKPQGTVKVDASAKSDVKNTSSKDSGTVLSSGKTVANTFEYLRAQGALVGYKS